MIVWQGMREVRCVLDEACAGVSAHSWIVR
jgi:hypothetical protein